jgi:hypothetical protein
MKPFAGVVMNPVVVDATTTVVSIASMLMVFIANSMQITNVIVDEADIFMLLSNRATDACEPK